MGHPIVADPVASRAEAYEFRSRYGLGRAPVLVVLLGSRESEVARLAPIFGAVVARVAAARPEVGFVVPAAASVVPRVRALVAQWPAVRSLHILDLAAMPPPQALAQKRAAFRAADAALAASGSVSLELAAAHTPMVIAYRMNWLSHKVMAAMAHIDTVTLVNLISETRAVPEFLSQHCRADLLAPAVLRLLAGDTSQDSAMALTIKRLGHGEEPPGRRAARAVLDGMETAIKET